MITSESKMSNTELPIIASSINLQLGDIIQLDAPSNPVLHDKIAETNALYYHATYVNPGWNKNKVVIKIGNHIFYSRI